jgi:hypothetical protein
MTSPRAILTLAASLVALAALAGAASAAPPTVASAPADAAPVVRLFDTGQPEKLPRGVASFDRRTGWKEVAERDLDHRFTGDPVFMNDQLAIVLRPGTGGALVYSRPTGKLRAELLLDRPGMIAMPPLLDVRTVENSASAVALDANYGRFGTVRLRLAAGAFFLEVRKDSGGPIWLSHYGKYVVVPDFFGDDVVYDAASAKGQFLPVDNSLLALADAGEAIIACVWARPSPKERVAVSLGNDARRAANRFDIPKDRSVWIAVFEGKDIWRDCPLDANDAGRAVALDWKPPFAAKWRASLMAGDASARSWYLRDSNVDVTPSAARQMLLIYPIDRTGATPLTTYCLTDLMRETLGVGPCQYVLDAEGLGQKGAAEAATPEPTARWIERELAKKPARRDGEALAQRLAAMVAHVRRAQERIDQYHRFAGAAGQLCRKEADEDLTGRLRSAVAILEDMAPPAPASGPATGLAAAPASIPTQVETLANGIAKLTDDERAMEKSRDALVAIRAAGARQDYELAKLRMGMRRLDAVWQPFVLGHDAADSPAGSVHARIERMIETMGLGAASRPAGQAKE